jgi:hypothetical protein
LGDRVAFHSPLLLERDDALGAFVVAFFCEGSSYFFFDFLFDE